MALLLQCEFLSVVPDESTTCNMDGQPMLLVLMGMTDEGEWLMVYLGQANMAKTASSEEACLASKEIVTKVHPDFWPKVRCGGSDGCASMRSSPAHAGIDGNRRAGAENFISFFNRDFQGRQGEEDDDDADTLAMHCLLYMVALALLDASDELPPWLMKFAQKITACFKNSCKKCANFKAHI